MKDWYSALELAGLPGLPETKSAVIRRADRDNWTARRRIGRGGGNEYLVADLPAEARTELARRALQVGGEPQVYLSAIREIFAGFRRTAVRTTYTVGGGAKARDVGELIFKGGGCGEKG